MSIITKWARNYKTRQWKVHEKVSLSEVSAMRLSPSYQLKLDICSSDSEYAKTNFPLKDPPRFYYDLEWIAADVDAEKSSCRVDRLAEPWRGHPAGALVMEIQVGMPMAVMPAIGMSGEELEKVCFYTIAVEVV